MEHTPSSDDRRSSPTEAIYVVDLVHPNPKRGNLEERHKQFQSVLHKALKHAHLNSRIEAEPAGWGELMRSVP